MKKLAKLVEVMAKIIHHPWSSSIEDGMTVKVLRMKNLVTLVTLLNNFFSKALPHMDHILHLGTGNFEVC